MYLDSHAHLSELSNENYVETVNRAAAADVSLIVNVGTNLSTSADAIKQLELTVDSNVVVAAGICPPELGTAQDGWENELRELCKYDGVRAIGEIGIDGINESYPAIDIQRPFFKKQLQIAKELNLPAIIHCRGAETEALETCIELNMEKALFHCFTGTDKQAQAIVDAGYTISFSGIITFKNSNFDAAVSLVPHDQLLFETDSPYLAPVPYRGKCNEPAYVAEIIAYAAEVRGVTNEELAETCRSTFDKLFSN